MLGNLAERVFRVGPFSESIPESSRNLTSSIRSEGQAVGDLDSMSSSITSSFMQSGNAPGRLPSLAVGIAPTGDAIDQRLVAIEKSFENHRDRQTELERRLAEVHSSSRRCETELETIRTATLTTVELLSRTPKAPKDQLEADEFSLESFHLLAKRVDQLKDQSDLLTQRFEELFSSVVQVQNFHVKWNERFESMGRPMGPSSAQSISNFDPNYTGEWEVQQPAARTSDIPEYLQQRIEKLEHEESRALDRLSRVRSAISELSERVRRAEPKQSESAGSQDETELESKLSSLKSKFEALREKISAAKERLASEEIESESAAGP